MNLYYDDRFGKDGPAGAQGLAQREAKIDEISQLKPAKQPICVAFGANLLPAKGDKNDILQHIHEYVSEENITIKEMSRLYRSRAVPKGSGPDYLNAAMLIECDFEPKSLLERLHIIEGRMGRVRAERWGPRRADLDLLFCGNGVLPDELTWQKWASLDLEGAQASMPQELILPHPRLHLRGFVLAPLLDIAPDWAHPVLGKTVRELWDALPAEDKNGVAPQEG